MVAFRPGKECVSVSASAQGNEPALGIPKGLVRDIARIVTPAHVPFAHIRASASPKADEDRTASASGPATP